MKRARCEIFFFFALALGIFKRFQQWGWRGLKKIGSHKPEEPMMKETKTADELLELLHERIRGFQLGSEPNPQFVRIVPVSDDKRANWKVAHSPKMEPPGDYWKAIERVMPELQEKYDLK